MCVWSIYVTFFHDWKLDTEFLTHCLLDLFVRRLLLVQKLAARKANDLQATVLVPFVELYKLGVVSLCKGSLRSHIDNQSALLSLHEVAQDVLFQVKVAYGDWPEFPDEVALIPVITCLP